MEPRHVLVFVVIPWLSYEMRFHKTTGVVPVDRLLNGTDLVQSPSTAASPAANAVTTLLEVLKDGFTELWRSIVPSFTVNLRHVLPVRVVVGTEGPIRVVEPVLLGLPGGGVRVTQSVDDAPCVKRSHTPEMVLVGVVIPSVRRQQITDHADIVVDVIVRTAVAP